MATTDTTTPIAEGKTKRIFPIGEDGDQVLIVSKDDITAGDGAKHDILEGKGAFATQTTCNVFSILKECGIPVAFDGQVDSITFAAPRCTMLPYEVVVRREAYGSYLKRMPGLPKGHYFPKLVLEFYLKTSGRKWGSHDLPCDDPLVSFLWDADETMIHQVRLFNPAQPIASQRPFLVLPEEEVFTKDNEADLIKRMGQIARRTFLVLEKCWQTLDRKLVDFKVEFGVTSSGDLLLADVIDNDSWRVLQDGKHIDKQAYREGGALDDVIARYALAAELTGQFRIPKQQVIVWSGSSKDDVAPIAARIIELTGDIKRRFTSFVVCSVHKQPVQAIAELHRLLQETPDSVVIAYVGRSNGAGPVLSAATTVSVITVPASYREFPDDVWSSLRTPSDVPVMTVLEPANAALAALNILAQRSPLLYMSLRERVEERLVNTITL
jgi:phosphoribosylaminoimidazole carboxylase/phosphoribosylaminoimidazole-succinocarboxamide synthase